VSENAGRRETDYQEIPDDPSDPIVVRCRVVARVRVPATLAFDVIRALNDEMTRYEEVYGEIGRPKPLDE